MNESIFNVTSIDQLHSVANIDKPKHPLISIIDYSKVDSTQGPASGIFRMEFYSVAYKRNCSFNYGHEKFNHQDGAIHCTAPGQIITYNKEDDDNNTEGWGLYFHPELIKKTALGQNIHQYTFFLYDENEALRLNKEEDQTLVTLLKQISREFNTNLDNYSDELIVSNLELLLNYCKRFYGRQLSDRSTENKAVVSRFEKLIHDYIHTDKLRKSGIPSVRYCASCVNLTPNYFSDLLKSETGMNTQEHIHYHLMEKAKALLADPDLSVDAVADELGFQYPQYFRKLFKKKVGLTPTQFRAQ